LAAAAYRARTPRRRGTDHRDQGAAGAARMTVLFVTGTDTEVGKTVVTAALVAALQAEGRSPYVVKPAQTGVTADDLGDLDEVRRLVGGVPGHEGVRLRAPLAPDTAARLEEVDLPSLNEQRDGILEVAESHDVLVEGAGGILVGLGEAWTLLDLAQAVARSGAEVAFVVVARAGLGTLNHTALTTRAITGRGLRVDGVVIGSWPDQPDLAAEQNLLDLPLITGVPLLGRVPAGSGQLGPAEFVPRAADWITVPRD
ncbi:MAG: dethiobiotin synthase, partial [Marmoricola sp.]